MRPQATPTATPRSRRDRHRHRLHRHRRDRGGQRRKRRTPSSWRCAARAGSSAGIRARSSWRPSTPTTSRPLRRRRAASCMRRATASTRRSRHGRRVRGHGHRDGTVSIKDKPTVGDVHFAGIGFTGRANFDDWAMHQAGIDPYASAKRQWLDKTRDERVRIGADYRKEQLARAPEYMKRNVAWAWSKTEGDAEARKQAMFDLWDDCAEKGDDEPVAAGDRSAPLHRRIHPRAPSAGHRRRFAARRSPPPERAQAQRRRVSAVLMLQTRRMPVSPASAFDGPLLGGRYRLGPTLGNGSQGEIFLARDEKAQGRRRRRSRRQAADAARHVEVVRAVRARGQGALAAAPRRRAAPPRDARGAARHVQPRHAARAGREPARARRAPPALARPSCATCSCAASRSSTTCTRARRPVVHRDIKPSNIVRAPDGKLALVDFGGVLDAARDKGGSTIVGTFGYMAPEQLHGQAIAGDRSLRARRDDRRARRRHRARGRPAQGPAHGSRRSTCPRSIPAFARRSTAMTDPDPDKRPQRARDVVALLAKARPARARDERALARTQVARSSRRAGCSPTSRSRSARCCASACSASAPAAGSAWPASGSRSRSTVGIFAALAFPRAQAASPASASELDSMLAEGQGGFTDMMRAAMARKR